MTSFKKRIIGYLRKLYHEHQLFGVESYERDIAFGVLKELKSEWIVDYFKVLCRHASKWYEENHRKDFQ